MIDFNRNPRILLTNDDGIQAPGMAVLYDIACQLSNDVWIVAPATEQSAMSHAISTRAPLRIHQNGPQKFAVTGTPADSVIVAVEHLMKDQKPDLILSGVNRGSNVSEDAYYSGTIAAAQQGGLYRIPAMALSQSYLPGRDLSWYNAQKYGASAIHQLVQHRISEQQKSMLWNINFPGAETDQADLMICGLGDRQSRDMRVIDGKDPGGRPYVWIGGFMQHDCDDTDSDLYALSQGNISATPLSHSRMDDIFLENKVEKLTVGNDLLTNPC